MISLSAFGLGFAAALVSLLGLLAVAVKAGWTRAHAPFFAVFSGSLILTLAATRLIPEALEGDNHALWFIVIGITLGSGLQFLMHRQFGQTAAALSSVLVIALHSFLDGGIFILTVANDPHSGLSIASGLILHEFPEAVMCFVLLQRAGLSNIKAGIFAFMAAGLTTTLGTIIADPIVREFDPSRFHDALALTAGLLIYVGLNQIFHMPKSAKAMQALGPIAAGVAVALVMGSVHHHEHAPIMALDVSHAPSWYAYSDCIPR